MTRFLIALAAMAHACANIQARDDAIEIKIAMIKVGEKARLSKTQETVTTFEKKVAGKVETKETKSGQKFVFIETILDRPDAKKKPTKLTHTYETAEITKEGNTETLSFSGKTVLIEKKDGKYQFTIDGKPLSEDDEKYLKQDVNSEGDFINDMLPGKAVKTGENWNVDLAKSFEKRVQWGDKPMTIDADKSKANAKLTKVYAKDDHRYGVLELNGELGLKTLNGLQTKAGSKMTIRLNLDTAIDDSTPYGTAKMNLKFELLLDIPTGGSVIVTSVSDITENAEKVK